MSGWQAAALVGLGWLAASVPADAAKPRQGSAAVNFVRARAAEVIGKPDAAAAGYAAALAAAPQDAGLAQRAFRQAMAAGDFPLARRLVAVLEARGTVPPDAQLFLLAAAVDRKDWGRASAYADATTEDELFGFLVPAIRAWIALGEGKTDPVALLDTLPASGLAGAYSSEHRGLLQIATGKVDEGVTALRAITGSDARQARLRLIAAAALQRAGRSDAALALLQSEDSATVAARALVAARKTLPAPIVTPADGLAELFARVAIDINRERVTPLSLTLGRLATFLAPDNAEGWLVVSELLAGSNQNDAALAALRQVRPADPFASYARASRIQVLARAGQVELALAEALAAATSPSASVADWVRVADLYGQRERFAESADAYGKALALAEAGKIGGDRWSLWLMRGGARERAGQWKDAKADLERAAALAPDEPAVLNYLGYAQIERRENLPAARKLIERASSLRPDDAAITDSLGWAYYLDGDVPKAIETLERAVAGEPGEPTINEHLGDAYWTAGRRREARFAWRAALVHAEEREAKRIRTKLDAGLAPEVAAP